jgi:hypothetical protein
MVGNKRKGEGSLAASPQSFALPFPAFSRAITMASFTVN